LGSEYRRIPGSAGSFGPARVCQARRLLPADKLAQIERALLPCKVRHGVCAESRGCSHGPDHSGESTRRVPKYSPQALLGQTFNRRSSASGGSALFTSSTSTSTPPLHSGGRVPMAYTVNPPRS
jgi:hypothetical protein